MFKKLLRRRSPDSLPHQLRINRIYIMPSKTGYIFLMMLAVMFLASLNSNNNLGFLITFFLGSFFVISILFTYKNLEGLRITALQLNPVFAGEPAQVNLLLEAARLTHHNIAFEGDDTLALVNVYKDSINQVQVAFNTEKRGVYPLSTITISSTYPLGLLSAWTYFRPEAELVVFPKPAVVVPTYNHFVGSELVTGAEIKTGGRDDFSSLREYVSGDALSNVHWKALAKGQGLFTKIFEGEAGGAFDFDFNQTSGEIETRLSYLSALIKNAELKRQAYSLRVPGVTLPVSMGMGHRNKCLEALARFSV